MAVLTAAQIAQLKISAPWFSDLVAHGAFNLADRLKYLDTTGIPVIPIGVNTENAIHRVDKRLLLKSDFSAILPAAAAAGELGFINGAAGASYLRGETAVTTKANTGRFQLTLPPRYVAGSNLTLVIHAKTLSAPHASAGIVVTAYRIGGEAAGGGNLGPASIAVTEAYGDKSFTITGATLSPGDGLDILVTANIDDTGGGSDNYVIMGGLKMTVPSRAI